MVLVQERHLATGGAIIVAVQEASVALGVVASTGIAGNSSIGDLGASLTALTAVSGGLRNLIGTTKTSARLTAVLEASLAGTLANTVGANGVEKVGQRSAIVLAISASFGTGSIGLATGERIIVESAKPGRQPIWHWPLTQVVEAGSTCARGAQLLPQEPQ